MSASTSSSSSVPPVLSKQEIAAPTKRNLAIWRPVLACGGAFLTGAILIRLTPEPVPVNLPATSLVSEANSVPLLLSTSQIVEARLALAAGPSGRAMKGQWKLTTDATGKATVAGEVARWVVEPGTHVEAGDRVVEISSGAASRPAPQAESMQDQAEQEQVAAANGQTALSQKLSIAQTQLVTSQERVERAQAKVAQARSLVKRLLAGEKIPAPSDSSKPVRVSNNRETPEATRLNRETKRAEDAAGDARDKVIATKSELDDAKKALSKAQKLADTAVATLTKAENDFKAEKTTADVLQNARADADDAQASLKAAQTRADVAQRAYNISQDKATSADSILSEARSTAQKAKIAEVESVLSNDDDGRYMTADQAATLVAGALRESKAAARQAERLHARVDDYHRQVKLTSQRVESASQDLQDAQQKVLDSVPRPQFTAAVSPVSGTITWISRLAREVGVGQSVFGISQGKNGFLRFEDTTGAWKAMNVGQTLQAANTPSVSVPPPSTSAPSPDSSMPASSALTPIGNSPNPAPPATTFSVRITRITPPSIEGQAAQIDAVRTDGSTTTEASTTEVQAAIPLDALPTKQLGNPTKIGLRRVIVPLAVILPRDGASYVAVVSPVKENTHTSVVEWRPVEIEHQTAFDVEIKSGLEAGERIVAQPILLLSESKPEEKKEFPILIEASD